MLFGLAVVAAVFGLVVGSFLNVVIHRVPEGESVVRPSSRCPSCRTPIRPRDNVPVVSWLLLRGRCRDCSAPISARYPAIEAVTGALFALVALRTGASWVLPAFLVLTAALLALSVIDLEHFVLPRQIIYAAVAVSAPLLVLAAIGEGEPDRLVTAGTGGLAAFAAMFLIHAVSPRGMGFGDVRLSGLLGMHLGWLGLGHVALGLFLGFLLGAVVGVALMAAGRRGRRDKVPFGPFLAAGAVLAILVGRPLLDLYLGT